MFWYYLERNDKEAEVYEDDSNFMEFIDYRHGDNYLFKVFAGDFTIKITFFHVLTDGTGGFYFFRQLLYKYFLNCGKDINTEGIVKQIEYPTTKEETDDKFMQIKAKKKEKKFAEDKALKLSGSPFKAFGTGIITAQCEIQKIKELASEYNTTITGYLCAIYMMSIYESYIKDKNPKSKIVCVSIPVNIRKKHPTKTKRNFSLVVRISYDFSNEITLDELIKICDEQLKSKFTIEQIDSQIKFNTGAERNIFMRAVPLFIKNIVLKIAYNIRGVRQETTNFSNLGKVEFPSEIKKSIKDINFILQTSKTTQKNFSAIGLDNKLYLAFSRRHIENKTEKIFFDILTSKGVKFVVQSNYWEMNQ